mgnify:CR=1 FL=1
MKVAYITSLIFSVLILIKIIVTAFSAKTNFDYGSLLGNFILFLVGVGLVFFFKKKINR